MESDKRQLRRAEYIEKDKPDEKTDVTKHDESRIRTRQNVAKYIIEFVRRRLYESKQKYKLRKKLRKERNMLRKEKRTNDLLKKAASKSINNVYEDAVSSSDSTR